MRYMPCVWHLLERRVQCQSDIRVIRGQVWSRMLGSEAETGRVKFLATALVI